MRTPDHRQQKMFFYVSVEEYNVPRKLDSALRWQCGSGPW